MKIPDIRNIPRNIKRALNVSKTMRKTKGVVERVVARADAGSLDNRSAEFVQRRIAKVANARNRQLMSGYTSKLGRSAPGDIWPNPDDACRALEYKCFFSPKSFH